MLSNDVRLKLSHSKSKKRVIQTKNIAFQSEHQLSAKYKSVSPDEERDQFAN